MNSDKQAMTADFDLRFLDEMSEPVDSQTAPEVQRGKNSGDNETKSLSDAQIDSRKADMPAGCEPASDPEKRKEAATKVDIKEYLRGPDPVKESQDIADKVKFFRCICVIAAILWVVEIALALVGSIDVTIPGLIEMKEARLSLVAFILQGATNTDQMTYVLAPFALCIWCALRMIVAAISKWHSRLRLFLIPKLTAFACFYIVRSVTSSASRYEELTFGFGSVEPSPAVSAFMFVSIALFILSLIASSQNIQIMAMIRNWKKDHQKPKAKVKANTKA